MCPAVLFYVAVTVVVVAAAAADDDDDDDDDGNNDATVEAYCLFSFVSCLLLVGCCFCRCC